VALQLEGRTMSRLSFWAVFGNFVLRIRTTFRSLRSKFRHRN